MSALLNAYLETLSATVTAGPLESEWKLIAVWVKRPAAESLGSANIAIHLGYTSAAPGVLYVAGGSNSSSQWISRGSNGTGNPVNSPVSLTDDVWTLCGTLVGPNTGSGVAVMKHYVAAASGTTNINNSAASARQLTLLSLGSYLSDATARWRGYIAEAAVFIPTSEANADAIMAELATTTADAIASGTPVWYAPLLSDGVATIGSDATVGGTTTFDADHPSLSGGGATDTPINPGAGTITITGYAPAVTQTGAVSLTPGVGTLSLVGYAPTIAQTTLGTIVTPVLKNNTGTVLANETGVVVNVYHSTTGALVLRKTGLTSSALGVVTITDDALEGGTTYAYEVVLSSNGRRLPTVAAA